MSRIAKILREHEQPLLADWIKEQTARGVRGQVIKEGELRGQSQELLHLLSDALDAGEGDSQSSAFAPVREMLTSLTRTRQQQGFTPSETAWFILSLKTPIIPLLRKEAANDPAIFDELQVLDTVLNQLGVFAADAYQKSREEVIRRQQMEMLELSTPVVKLWDGVLALPLIGTLDSQRTSVVMETLLQRIVETSSPVAIIDITGVPTVDTLVAQHLIKTVAAARLMGAECIISGVRPQIAQTIVHLGVDLSAITTKGSLADAFAVALRTLGLHIAKKG
jgi:rsbT co-antagonist protein RsbR